MNYCKHKWCYERTYYAKDTKLPWIVCVLLLNPDYCVKVFTCSTCGKNKELYIKWTDDVRTSSKVRTGVRK